MSTAAPARIASAILVNALLRRIGADGGMGAVLARGDASAGAILLVLADRGVPGALVERMLRPDGGYAWGAVGPADPAAPGAVTDYVARRRRGDPDLWAVELDHPRAAEIAAGMLAG